jgi:3-oxoadipate enol-lactonase
MSSAAPRGRSGRLTTTVPLRTRIRRREPATAAGSLVDIAPPDDGIELIEDPPVAPPGLPAGRAVNLPGRGRTWMHDTEGPADAPTLILLHGWTVTGAVNWFTAFPALSAGYRVVALDHRGHGRGLRPNRRFRLEDCADDVVALADVLGINRFVPVGYSMGGPIAQLVWHRHPERVAGLVLCATSRNFRGTHIERAVFSAFGGLSMAARLTPVPWRRGLSHRLTQRRWDDSELGRWAHQEGARNDPRALIEAGHALGRYTSHHWIEKVDVPTAVVLTEHDPVVPPERQRRLARSIPGATVFPVPGDHGACVRRPDLFVPALARACGHVTGVVSPLEDPDVA